MCGRAPTVRTPRAPVAAPAAGAGMDDGAVVGAGAGGAHRAGGTVISSGADPRPPAETVIVCGPAIAAAFIPGERIGTTTMTESSPSIDGSGAVPWSTPV